MAQLTKIYDVIHIRGKDNLIKREVPAGYKQFEFVGRQIGDIYAASDIMLSRAGATAVFEILELALPALLVPLPITSSRGDQILNAGYFKQKGFSYVLEQENLNSDSLFENIQKVYESRTVLKNNMKNAKIPNAAQKIAEIIVNE